MATLLVTSPFDGTHLGTLTLHSAPEVEVALRTADRLHTDRSSWIPRSGRLEILRQAAALIEEQAEELARIATLEGGKPFRDSLVEVNRGLEGIRSAIATLRTYGGHEVPMGLMPATEGRYATTLLEPAGVVLAISAFNHPFNMVIHQVIPCIAAGCPVLIKPALSTPLSCKRLVEILYEAGLPTAWCQMILCDNEVTAKVAQDPRLALVSFIGASPVGWQIRSKLAPGVRCVLEHGGAAPVIVHEDADIPDMLPRLAKGSFYHAGQVCVSVQRVMVPDALFDEVASGLAELAKEQVVGNPLDEVTDVGPMIRPESVDKVDEWVQEAGGVIAGGQRLLNQCYAPTVLANPSHKARVSTQEIFGPVICLYRYETLKEAIHQANALPYIFQAAVFGQNLSQLMDTARQLKATAVMINDHTAFRADWMPFGGRGTSGMGTGGIPFAIGDLLPQKLIVVR